MQNYEELWKNKKKELAAKVVETQNVEKAVAYAKELADMELHEQKTSCNRCVCDPECETSKDEFDPEASSEEMFVNLAKHAAPFVKFIHDNFTPHTVVVISDNLVRVMTDEIGVPMKEEE